VKRAVIAGFLAALLGSGAAYGYWSTAGVGTGAAGSGTAVSLTLSPGTPTSLLYPGTSADVALTINNPNTFPVRVERVYLDPAQGNNGFSADVSHTACPLTSLSFTTQTNGGTGWTVAAGSALSLHLNGSLAMAFSAANTCQGATFQVYLGTSGSGS
jgi:hypothetical protein